MQPERARGPAMGAALLVIGVIAGAGLVFATLYVTGSLAPRTTTDTTTETLTTTQTLTTNITTNSSGSLPSPATITSSAAIIDAGQAVSIGVGWKGGSAPYTITLYGSTSGGCTSSSTVLGTKSGQSQPQFIFTVSPAATTRYCGTVSSSSGSSTVSSSVVVSVNPS